MSDNSDLGPPANHLVSLAVFIAVALIAQILFWCYSIPGPQLRGPCDLNQAMACCVVSAISLLVVPLVVALVVLGKTPTELGLGWGDRNFGCQAIFWCVPAIVIGTWFGSRDPQIQAFYPIPGDSVGDSWGMIIQWWGAYLLFYVSFEFFYRGFLLNGWEISNRNRYAITVNTIQTVCCFLVHIGKPNLELIASLPASFLFGWIAWRSRSIWYGVIIHFAIGTASDWMAM